MAKLLALAMVLGLASVANAETHRVAIVVGNNAGDGKLTPLRFAEADASKVARALTEVGQVEPEDLMVLQGRGRSDIEAAFARARSRIAELHRSPDARVVLVFYFSGHSDGEALELGRDRLPFRDLKDDLAGLGADVRMTIVDSCRSGAAVQTKGGKAVAAFTLRLADDLTTRGEALMASSAADEVALESPELQGSYFTSALVSGLRGAADTSGDRQVTLAEAYRYAYDHTVSSTAVTLEGAQHPTYDFRLTGQGELILATLDRPRAALVLPEGLDRAMVVDVARDQVVAELLPGAARFVALAPGTYAVRGFQKGKILATRVSLAENQTREVAFAELEHVEAPRVARKGPGDDGLSAPAESTRTLRLGVSAGVASGVADKVGPRGDLRVSIDPGLVEGLALIFEGAYGSSSGVTEGAAHARLGYQFPIHVNPSLRFGLGAEAGPGLVTQRVDGATAGTAVTFAGGPRATCAVALTPSTELQVEGGVPFTRIDVDGVGSWVALPSATAGVVFDF